MAGSPNLDLSRGVTFDIDCNERRLDPRCIVGHSPSTVGHVCGSPADMHSVHDSALLVEQDELKRFVHAAAARV